MFHAKLLQEKMEVIKEKVADSITKLQKIISNQKIVESDAVDKYF